MNLQTIKSLSGQVEYVLLPVATFNALRNEISEQLKYHLENSNNNYEKFNVSDYISNPVALARIEAGITQKELAKLMHVTQAYISKLERTEKVSVKIMQKVKNALK